jgi:hypothetical protein
MLTSTAAQQTQLTVRADLVARYRDVLSAGRVCEADELREGIRDADDKLRQLGIRGRLPSPDLPAKRAAKRSARRRQDAPNLPTRRVSKTTVGREYAGRYRPSMFVTLTCDSYGSVRQDGTPVDPEGYDYRRAARDAVHFTALVDRWWQNLRRVLGWDVQYFATIEPQKRMAPHLHAALRGSIPHEVIRQVTAATYHQVWWPPHDHLVYTGGRLPVWEPTVKGFIDPDTRQPLTRWAEALERITEPAHVVTFGSQVHSKGILGGTDDAGRHLGYLTKYLVKSVAEIVEPSTEAQQRQRRPAACRAVGDAVFAPVWGVAAVWHPAPGCRVPDGARTLQKPGPPPGHPGPARPPGARIPEMVRQDPGRSQSRPHGLRHPGTGRGRDRQTGTRPLPIDLAQARPRRPQRANPRAPAHAGHRRAHHLASRIRPRDVSSYRTTG